MPMSSQAASSRRLNRPGGGGEAFHGSAESCQLAVLSLRPNRGVLVIVPRCNRFILGEVEKRHRSKPQVGDPLKLNESERFNLLTIEIIRAGGWRVPTS